MPGCCSGARSILIETTVLRVDGETCDRCNETLAAVRQAAGELEAELAAANVSVSLVEHATTSQALADSNAVLVNGRPIEEWIGGERLSTDCPSCGDLVGESVCCSAISVDGVVNEAMTAQHVRDAALSALGLSSGSGCC